MKNQKTAEDIAEDHCCPICLHVYYKPVNLPCRHIFCRTCLDDSSLIGQNYKCPLCRTPFRPIDLQHNEQLAVRMMQLYPRALEEKKKSVSERVMMRFVVGNTTEVLQTNEDNKYQWNFYVKPVEGDKPLSENISKIHVKLHHTFNPPVLKYPLNGNKTVALTRTGWGTFRINVVIFWKNQFREEQSEIYHDLQFEPVQERIVYTALTLK